MEIGEWRLEIGEWRLQSGVSALMSLSGRRASPPGRLTARPPEVRYRFRIETPPFVVIALINGPPSPSVVWSLRPTLP